MDGSAEDPLQECIVQIACDSFALRKAFGEAGPDTRSQPAKAKNVQQPKDSDSRKYATNPEPHRLEESRRNSKVGGCSGLVPQAVVVAGNHAKLIVARGKIAVKCL